MRKKLEELQNYIQSYFKVSHDHLQQIAQLFEEEELQKGNYFIKTGQYCKKLSFVKEGIIRVFANTEQKEVTQWIGAKGFFLTDLYSFTFDQKARWNMQALTDCKLYTIHKKNYDLLHTIVPTWTAIQKECIAGCFVMLENRVFNHLSLNAEERYDQFFESNKELFHQVPLHYLASMLGMSAETFSRIRNKKKS